MKGDSVRIARHAIFIIATLGIGDGFDQDVGTHTELTSNGWDTYARNNCVFHFEP